MLVMPTVFGRPVGFAYQSIRHFVDCLAEDEQPMATGEDGLAAGTELVAGATDGTASFIASGAVSPSASYPCSLSSL